MSNVDYLPKGDLKLLQWVTNLLVVLLNEELLERWRILPPTETLKDALEQYNTSIDNSRPPFNTSLNIKRKNEAKKTLVKEVRGYVQGFIARNPYVTGSDKILLQLPVPDTIPTNVPQPTTQVTGTLAFRGIGLIEMRDIRPTSEKPDPRAGYGVRIYWGIIGEASEFDAFRLIAPPATGAQLPHSVFTRRNRYLFDFAQERGREVFFCMRYENSKGEAGPWGKLISAFVP